MSTTNRVLIIYTGGTIGMKDTPRGYAPAPGFLSELLAAMPPFHDRTMPAHTTPISRYGRRVRYDILEYAPLLDSSNMGLEDWVKIARDIERHYDAYDAFIVLHGTDTMAYTASALSFMLENLGKTVILTGSQIPLAEARSDAIGNVLGALTIAGHYEIPEVCLYFDNRLMRGNRTQKTDASGLAAFASGNAPPLVEVGIEVKVEWDRILAPPTRPFRVNPITHQAVAALRLFPGISAEMITNVLRPPTEGLVLESFGAGNAPDHRADFLDALRAGTDRGVVIVNVTQCQRGAVTTDYATGAALADVGVIGGADMTPEAALTKLAWLLSQGLPRAEVARLMQSNLRGELTSTATQTRFSFRERVFIASVARALAEAGESVTRVDVERALLARSSCAPPPGSATSTALGPPDLASGAEVDAADYDGRTAPPPRRLGGPPRRRRVACSHRGAKPRPRGSTAGAAPRCKTPIRHRHPPARRWLLRRHGATLGARPAPIRALRPRRRPATLNTASASVLDAGADPERRRLRPPHPAPPRRRGRPQSPRSRCSLARGADPRARDRWQQAPRDEALRGGHAEVARLLDRA
jgi:lysophospholipase